MRNGVVELTYITVEFEKDGREYVYHSPFLHRKGDLVLVNVYGQHKVATVLSCSTDTDYDGPVKMISGVAYRLEELDQPAQPKQTKSLLRTIVDYVIE